MGKSNTLHEMLSGVAASSLLDVPDASPMCDVVNVFRAFVEENNFSEAYKALIAIVEFDDTYYAASDQTKHTVRLRQRARKAISEMNAASQNSSTRRELEKIRETRKIPVKR